MLKAKQVKIGKDVFITSERLDKTSEVVSISQIYVSAREGFTLLERREEMVERKRGRKGAERLEVTSSEIIEARAFSGLPVEIDFDLEDEDAEEWTLLFFGDLDGDGDLDE